MKRDRDKPSSEITLAITGASGAQYGLRLLQCLLDAEVKVFLLISNAAQVVINTETDHNLPQSADPNSGQLQEYFDQIFSRSKENLRVLGLNDWMSPVASGTSCPRTMVVCPCSGGTLSAIATGACNNLIERGADVVLKERGKLILVSRETPYSSIHLEHMLKLSQMGVVILPASPGFYQSPKSINDLIDFIVARILDQIGVPQNLLKPWAR